MEGWEGGGVSVRSFLYEFWCSVSGQDHDEVHLRMSAMKEMCFPPTVTITIVSLNGNSNVFILGIFTFISISSYQSVPSTSNIIPCNFGR